MANFYDSEFDFENDVHRAKFKLDRIMHEEEINSFMNMLKRIASVQIFTHKFQGLTFEEIEYVLGKKSDADKVIKCGVLREVNGSFCFKDYGIEAYLMSKQMEHLSYDKIIETQFPRYKDKILTNGVMALCYLYLSQKNITIKAKLMVWISKQTSKKKLSCIMEELSEKVGQLTPTNQENILKFTLLKHITGGIKW